MCEYVSVCLCLFRLVSLSVSVFKSEFMTDCVFLIFKFFCLCVSMNLFKSQFVRAFVCECV